ncbi:hypothetical protein SAMCFNEI73_Ch2277 [Sinorhizobium americanum]|uniref:Uncharacterized protein n=1 Tax=Sinorhizobium americanum TaxID=194963 RepID=A0A1L3LN83_9HYPH|nr:hypothetical protein SAMCCGM7_Ch2169 [Sinorhizobium americanum CCGM7]APG91560.1 hypothetical protein SAMCFNEI73_Ch2277 [Sinorhizobium americanum]
MLRALVFLLLNALSTASAFATGQTGDPRYLVKAWIQRFDKSAAATTFAPSKWASTRFN